MVIHWVPNQSPWSSSKSRRKRTSRGKTPMWKIALAVWLSVSPPWLKNWLQPCDSKKVQYLTKSFSTIGLSKLANSLLRPVLKLHHLSESFLLRTSRMYCRTAVENLAIYRITSPMELSWFRTTTVRIIKAIENFKLTRCLKIRTMRMPMIRSSVPRVSIRRNVQWWP